MMKFLIRLALIMAIFGLGYYVGQSPPGEVKEKVRTLSEDVIEKTGLHESLNLKLEYIEAKDRLLQAKADYLDRELQTAAMELDQALSHLNEVVKRETDPSRASRLGGLMAKIQSMQQSLEEGQTVARRKLDEAQQELNDLIP